MKSVLLLLLGVIAPLGVFGQNLMPNPSMETGSNTPSQWFISGVGVGVWATQGHSGSRSISVDGATGQNRYWESYSCPVQAGKGYVARFWQRGSNSLGGFTIAGFDTVRRDFSRPGTAWADSSYVAWIPSAGASSFRLGSYDATGTYFYDDVEVAPLNPVYKLVGPYRLGDGESISAGRYTHDVSFGGYGGNFARCLSSANTTFNSFKWYMNPGSAIVYHHELGGQTFSNAQVTCTIQNYNNISSKTVVVEASTNGGTTWLPVGAMTGTNAVPISFPAGILPAADLYVRLKSTNALQFGLTSYKFAADVPDTNTAGFGETSHFAQFVPSTNIQIAQASSMVTGKVATLSIFNSSNVAQTFDVSAKTEYLGNFRERTLSAVVAPGATNLVEILLPTAGFGDNTCLLTVKNGASTILMQHSLRFNVSIVADDSYGELLPSSPECPVWWCAGPYKVGRTRAVPLATNTTVRVAAARNEYEPFQLVLRPQVALSNVTVSVSDFTGVSNAAVIAATNVTICQVEYVNVTQLQPNEIYSATGEHPDPLVPVSGPFTAAAGTNCPLWFTVRVPKDAPGGEYAAVVTVNHAGGAFTVSVRLRVFDFALTDVTHTRTAYGAILQYAWHGLTNNVTLTQERAVWELYMQDMARHRISPFFPQWYSEVQWSYNSGNQSFTHDFAEFDSAMERYLEEYQFNTFKDINYNRELPPINGVARFNASNNAINSAYRPLYTKLMQPIAQHLRERGWIDLAYSFWLDEPQAGQYALARDGMLMVEEVAPDMGRFQSEFIGPTPSVNATIWVSQWPYSDYTEGQKRQAAGEQFWFYYATHPVAPEPNNFIDHPAINPRIRSWYAERQGFDGEEYYGINYYLGTPNPWLDPMSSTGPIPEGIIYWGNGDGTLVYPPVKEKPATPVIAGPIDSLRWEMIRDGMEDREYFWLLKRVLAIAEPQLGTNHPAVIEGRAAKTAAMAMLAWPAAYPYDTEKLLASRLRIAEAIEALDDGAPFIAKQPLSKAVTNGAAQTLRLEAGGWPLPSIQWQHAGTNLPGATTAKLFLTNITLSMAGDYRVILSNSVGTATSAVGKLTVLDVSLPPQIIAQPASLTRTNLGRAVFGVGASSLTPITYQWLRDGVPIAGATNVTFLLTNLAATNAGYYSVIVSNAAGTAASTAASLSIVPPEGAVGPTITNQPVSSTNLVGQNPQFTVAASGTAPLSYQWYWNGTNLSPGGNGSSLTLTNVQLSQAGQYQVIVGNVAGAVTSVVATLTVQTLAPFITSPPTNLTVIQGQGAQFGVVADGTGPLNYQWFFNASNLLTGANSSSLSLTNVQPAQTGSYFVRITNVVGAVTSAPAMLSLQGLPNYTNEPPGVIGYLQGADLILSLDPDNRPRTVLVSTNLVDWQSFYTATPSAALVLVPVSTTNGASRYFRLVVGP